MITPITNRYMSYQQLNVSYFFSVSYYFFVKDALTYETNLTLILNVYSFT